MQCAKNFKETESESKDFIAMMKDRSADRNMDDILNMDQTLITHSFQVKKTLEAKQYGYV
jgi:hypothetical protein